MSSIRVYINTFDSGGSYSGFQEITDDTDIAALQKISQKLDNSTYDVGVFKNTSFNLKLRNDHGKFSEVGVDQSIFVEKRIDSLVKVTWGANEPEDLICGVAICGEAVLGDEINMFYGLLNDITSSQNIRDQKIAFSCQGLESIFDRIETNYSSLNPATNISGTIFDLLDEAPITSLMTIDAGNISVGQDQVPDTIADLEETTVKEALDKLLEASNSVMYIDVSNQTLYVKPRTAAVSSSYTFYGQASDNGSENIVDIKKVRTGLNRTFNFWKWSDTTTTAKDATSISDYGVRKKELNNDLLTDSTKRSNLLTDYKDEFKDPKQELDLTGILDYDTAQLFLLDRVVVDYPTVFEAAEGSDLPIFGLAIFGQAKFPLGQWNLTINTSKNFKILGRSVDLKNNLLNFTLREI